MVKKSIKYKIKLPRTSRQSNKNLNECLCSNKSLNNFRCSNTILDVLIRSKNKFLFSYKKVNPC